MTSITLAYRESSQLTRTSSRDPAVRGVETLTATRPEECIVIFLGDGRGTSEAPPAGYQFVSDVVKGYEADEGKRTALAKARSWLADMSDEGRSLRAFRRKKGLSQAALAHKAGMTQAHIARLESGQLDAQVSTVLRLAEALELKPATLFNALLTVRAAPRNRRVR